MRSRSDAVIREVSYQTTNLAVRLSPQRPMVFKGANAKTKGAMFIYAARQVHKKTGESIHYCSTLNEALLLEDVADVKVVRFAGGLSSMLDAELLASEQMRIDEIWSAKRKSFSWRKIWPFARAA